MGTRQQVIRWYWEAQSSGIFSVKSTYFDKGSISIPSMSDVGGGKAASFSWSSLAHWKKPSIADRLKGKKKTWALAFCLLLVDKVKDIHLINFLHVSFHCVRGLRGCSEASISVQRGRENCTWAVFSSPSRFWFSILCWNQTMKYYFQGESWEPCHRISGGDSVFSLISLPQELPPGWWTRCPLNHCKDTKRNFKNCY